MPTDDITSQALMRRHALFVEAACAALLQAWRSHFERVPGAAAERKEILVALGALGGIKTPRDPRRMAALPAMLLAPEQLDAIGREVEDFHAELAGLPTPPAEQGG